MVMDISGVHQNKKQISFLFLSYFISQAHHLIVMDILEFVLNNMEGVNACRFDGDTEKQKRDVLIEQFSSWEDTTFNVMILSMEVGSEGLSLTGANVCIVYEHDWTQAKSDQAMARICRPGQTKECESNFLFTAGTVEEKIFGKQAYKGILSRIILTQGNGKSHWR